jgi:hypothetical protein
MLVHLFRRLTKGPAARSGIGAPNAHARGRCFLGTAAAQIAGVSALHDVPEGYKLPNSLI